MSSTSSSSAWALWADGKGERKLKTGCEQLDDVLGGGVPLGLITEVAGESATGKTQLVLQLCLQVQLPVELGGLDGGAVYISTEGSFPSLRLRQLEKCVHERHTWTKQFDFCSNVMVHSVHTIGEQERALFQSLPKIMKERTVRLVVLDSIAALTRSEFEGKRSSVDRASHLMEVAGVLKRLAGEHGCAVIVVNQVSDVMTDRAQHAHLRHTSIISSGRLTTPALGLPWASCVGVRILLSRRDLPDNQVTRHLRVAFAPHLPDYTECDYRISDRGFEAIQD